MTVEVSCPFNHTALQKTWNRVADYANAVRQFQPRVSLWVTGVLVKHETLKGFRRKRGTLNQDHLGTRPREPFQGSRHKNECRDPRVLPWAGIGQRLRRNPEFSLRTREEKVST